MEIRRYRQSDCKELTELFYNTVHTVNAKDYTKEQLDSAYYELTKQRNLTEYGKDIIFYVKKLVKTSSTDIAILCGLFERIEADSKLDDLELLDNKTIKNLLC